MPSSRRAVLAAMATGAVLGCVSSAGPARDGRGSRARPPLAGPGNPGGSAAASVTPRPTPRHTPGPVAAAPRPRPTRAQVVARYGRRGPGSWGLSGPGIVSALPTTPTTRRVIALTFDACGGPAGQGYDRDLIDFLRRREIPATLFLNSHWIDAHLPIVRRLAAEPLFEIANHGTHHRPLSVTGRSAYGIEGTRGAGEVYDEVMGNQVKLTRLLGFPPRFFRSGTAHCDDIAARIVTDLGACFVGFTVNADGGATLPADRVARTVAAARGGSIVIGHMNHPGGGTAAGIAAAVPRLLASGHRFVRLRDALGQAQARRGGGHWPEARM